VTIPVWIGLYRALSNVANEVDILKPSPCRCHSSILLNSKDSHIPDAFVSSLKGTSD
jgi:hypothetical protein